MWACQKCHLYLAGLHHFDLVVDHHPLVPIINSKTLTEIENPRLQRLREKLTPYSFSACWQPHRIPDALSRAPVSDPAPEDELAEVSEAVHPAVVAALQ